MLNWWTVSYAFLLGVQAAVSPCPLAANVAAVSFVGRRAGHPKRILAAGLFYTLGRMCVYTGLGALLTAGLMSVPAVSTSLQTHMNTILGPALILTGVLLLELLPLKLPGIVSPIRMQNFAEKAGPWGAFVLGVVFALAFCPVSAGLFFGGLLPFSLKEQSVIVLPSLFGIGTALPVALFSILLAFSAQTVKRVYDRIVNLERWTRRGAGVMFIVVGVYYVAVYILKI